ATAVIVSVACQANDHGFGGQGGFSALGDFVMHNHCMHQRLEENQNATAISTFGKKGLRITKIQQRYLPLEKRFTYNQNTTTISTFRRMFSDGIHTNVIIRASDGSIGSHRAVITAYLPIFDLMFTHELKEKDLCVIKIPKMSIKVCQPFLSYLYSNKFQNQDLLSHRLDLLRVADTYDVSDLKDVCQDILIEDIDSDNMMERLQTAFRYHLPRLKICCINYQVRFGNIFDIKDEFNAFIQSAHQELVDAPPWNDDLRIDTYISGGSGGQHANTTNSVVRIAHILSGLTVAIQDEMS
nr:SKP1/BTB/POZ domain-containing protein [Tanacetum cinerariifolium]